MQQEKHHWPLCAMHFAAGNRGCRQHLCALQQWHTGSLNPQVARGPASAYYGGGRLNRFGLPSNWYATKRVQPASSNGCRSVNIAIEMSTQHAADERNFSPTAKVSCLGSYKFHFPGKPSMHGAD